MDWKKVWKTVWEQLCFPPLGIRIFLTVFSAVSLAVVFIKELSEDPIAYIIYVISFYTVVILSVFFGRALPKWYKKIKQKVCDNPFGNRYMTDLQFKNQISLYRSLMINVVYIAVNAFSAWFYHTAWFGIFAVYYMILAGMRFLLVRYTQRNKLGENRLLELKRARMCATMLTTLNLILSGAILMILYQNRGFAYHGILIYVMALYTFYVTTAAIIDLVKYRRYKNPILSVSKVIKMAAAMVSMLLLETAMFSSFGEEMPLQSQKMMIIMTGAGISAAVIIMAGYIIVQTTKEMKYIIFCCE